MLIDRLDFIDEIRKIENNVAYSTGREVIDISHWNPGKSYQEKMLSTMELIKYEDPINYKYGYMLDSEFKNEILHKLGATHPDFRCVIVQSCTLAIVNIANLLKYRGIKSICILQPSYFSVELCFKSFQIETTCLNLVNNNGILNIPVCEILSSGCKAVWITSPVFSVGCYFKRDQVNAIQLLVENNILVICDEALCTQGNEISRQIQPSKNFISFYSPHKAIAVNAVKFAVIVCNNVYVNFLEQWSDVFNGGLSSSNMMAIEHYISSNYSKCRNIYDAFIQQNINELRYMLNFFNYATILDNTSGQYTTIFMPEIPYKLTLSLKFIKDIIQGTHCSLLPGHLMGFDEEYGFCFRVNLLLNSNILIKSINDVIKFIY
jgi:aspartate/methionine/tyrosine aminotransferase